MREMGDILTKTDGITVLKMVKEMLDLMAGMSQREM